MTEVDPSPRAVINASPLIFLSKGGYLTLLQLISEEILVPDPGAAEIGRRGAHDITAKALEETDWLRVVLAPAIPTDIGSWDLGPGESAVLALAHEVSGMEAIIDDLAGRRCAASLEIPIRGTLGIVLYAKRKGHIREAQPVIERLIDVGMYLSDSVVKKALKIVGE